MPQFSSLKEHIKSFLVTFVAMFALAVLAGWDNASWTKEGLMALGLAGVRAGVKAVLEMFALLKPTTTVTQ